MSRPPARVRRTFPASNHESCGVDTLYLCAKITGFQLSLRHLDETVPRVGKGVSLAALADAVRANGISGKLATADLSRLCRWQSPAIMYINANHFVGFLGTTDDGRLLVFDNSVGLIECTIEWFNRRYPWGGEVLVLGRAPSAWQEAIESPWVVGPGCFGVLLLVSAALRRTAPKGYTHATPTSPRLERESLS